MSKYVCYGLGVAALSLLLSASASAATLARQCGAFGIVTYDFPETHAAVLARQCGAFGIMTYDPPPVTETTPVSVPYTWLDEHVQMASHESAAYEAAAKASAANGWKVWECYALGLDPQVAASDFRIVSFPMKADGTPDLENIVLDPPQERWNVQDAQVVLKCAEKLTGPWWTVPAESGSPGTARPTMRFFKAVVLLGDAQDDPGIVQLWEGGPYWATTNIGAEEPWDYGYYFWWGDTVGYTNTGSGWISVKDGTSILLSSSGTAASTYGKGTSELLSAGYIDSTGNLAPEHDAAQIHWGGGWRMPTEAECSALVNNCTYTWITTNGVNGRLIKGKGDYANRSIFIPAAGYGYDSRLDDAGRGGDCWSSTPDSENSGYAWILYFGRESFGLSDYYRYAGRSVRPVRGSAQ